MIFAFAGGLRGLSHTGQCSDFIPGSVLRVSFLMDSGTIQGARIKSRSVKFKYLFSQNLHYIDKKTEA